MNIPLQDSLIIFSILYFFGFISFLSISTNNFSSFNKSFPYFSGYFILNCLGIYGIYFRRSIPFFISVILANLILYLSQVFLLIAIDKFYKIAVPFKTIIISTILYLVTFSIFAYIYPNFKIRILILNIGLIFNLVLIYHRHNTQIKKYNLSRGIFGITIITMILINIFRILMLLFPTNVENFLDYNFYSLSIILAGITGNMVAFGILSIVNNKNLYDLVKVGNIFENSINNAPIPIIIHAEDGAILNVSQNWTELTLYTKSDIQTIFDWGKKAYGKDKDEIIEYINTLYKSNKKYHYREVKVLTKDKRKLTWNFKSGYIGNLPDGRAVVMSVAIDVTNRIEREKKINYLSYHDQLTGLYNRRFFEEEKKRLDNPRNLPLSIIIGDINGLKLTNDAFGHLAGDKLIKVIGNIISETTRKNDIAARWGGDEFIILLPNSKIKDANLLINRIQKKIKETSFEYGNLSISFGADTKKEEDEDIDEIFIEAEKFMYQNKLIENKNVRGETIKTIITTLFKKSIDIKDHSMRVSDIAVSIANKMGLSQTSIDDIKTMGIVHDIGQIIIDLSILDKPNKLTDEERKIIEQHPLSGSKMLNSSPEYARLSVGILHHHERIDGKGYPSKIAGDQIPIESKIIAVADAFDAMTSKKPYRLTPLSLEEAITELKENSGSQFDKKIVDIFITEVLKR